MRFVKVVVTTIIILLGIVFIIENLEMLKHAILLKLDLYIVTFESPAVHLWVVVLFAFFLGVFTASLYGIYELIVQRQTIRRLKHNLNILSEELKACAPATPSQPPEAEASSQSE
jgi:chromate transport protein ChrA